MPARTNDADQVADDLYMPRMETSADRSVFVNHHRCGTRTTRPLYLSVHLSIIQPVQLSIMRQCCLITAFTVGNSLHVL